MGKKRVHETELYCVLMKKTTVKLSSFAVPYIPMKIHMNFPFDSTMPLLIFIGVGIFHKNLWVSDRLRIHF